ncbi:hypothetical protein T08_13778 [Trichinella sp. T8]|nr:hypothetical protein T08_13778 [Trichinella sp. T8]
MYAHVCVYGLVRSDRARLGGNLVLKNSSPVSIEFSVNLIHVPAILPTRDREVGCLVWLGKFNTTLTHWRLINDTDLAARLRNLIKSTHNGQNLGHWKVELTYKNRRTNFKQSFDLFRSSSNFHSSVKYTVCCGVRKENFPH